MIKTKKITKRLQQAKAWLQADMEQAEGFQIAEGCATAFTTRSPDKDTANEDSVAMIPLGSDTAVLVVADGVGGMPTGHEASGIAINEVIAAVEAAAQEDRPIRNAILNGIERANRRLLETTNGSATTLAVVEISGSVIRPYHVGDVVILVTGQRGHLKLQTVAHSPVGYAVEAGLLDEDDAVVHHQRHLVSNVVGLPDMRIEVGAALALAPRDTLCISSDGIPDNLYTDEIVESIRKGPLLYAANALADECGQRMLGDGEHVPAHADDRSFILYRRNVARSRKK